MSGLTDRSTGDLLVLMIAGTVCFSALATGAAIAAIEIRDPEVDTDAVVAALRDLLGTLVGLLAGYLAGRGHVTGEPPHPEEGPA